MAVSAADPISDLVRRIGNIERQLDRNGAARILSAPIGGVDMAPGAVGNGQVNVGALHPNRLSTWPAANNVLYDTGGGVSVAQVQDILCAVNSIHGNKIISGSLTGTQIQDRSIGAIDVAVGALTSTEVASRAMTSIVGQQSTPSAHGAGAWAFNGMGVTATSLQPGNTVVLGIFSVSHYCDTASAILGLGIGIDTTAGPTWYSHYHEPIANYVMSSTVCFLHNVANAAHAYYGITYTNAGTLYGYGTSQLMTVAFHR